MKISREFKVGLVAIIALLLLYWGLNFLKGQNIFEEKREYYAVYTHVDGLTAARPIFINGLQVGQVEHVYFHPNGSGLVVVKMDMTSEFPISKNTTASIQSDILGENSIDLILGDSKEQAQTGDTLLSNIKLSLTEEVNQQVAPLKQKAEKLFASMDTVLTLISGFLNSETKDNFMETFNSIRRSFKRLEHTVGSLDQTVEATQDEIIVTAENIAAVTGTLNDNTEELSNIIQNMSSISDSLAQVQFAQTLASLQRAMVSAEQITEKINNGEGSLGKLVNDQELYDNLTDASRQLDLLLLDIKYNPKRYINFSVFGKDRPYDAEEAEEIKKQSEKQQNGADENQK